MKTNYSKLLIALAGIAGFSSFSLVITLPSEAKEALNPNPSIFNEAPYNKGQHLQVNAQYTPVEAASVEKGNTKRKQVAQKGSVTNPKPSIFNEPPYNRGRSVTPDEVTPRPPGTTPPTPETQPSETPTPTPPGPGASDNQGKNLLALVESNPSFTILTRALKAAGLTGALEGKDNLTIFAPTDAAFAKFPDPNALEELLKADNKEILIKILNYHLVPGKVLSTDLKSGEIKSREGGVMNVKVDPAIGVTINNYAKVTQADITASNGVIHAIDVVMLPPDL